jgi:hypothetical protein
VAAPALAAATRLIPLTTDNGHGGAPVEPGEVQRAAQPQLAEVQRAAQPQPATVAAGNGHGTVPPVAAPTRRRVEPSTAGGAARPSGPPRRPILPPEPPHRRSPWVKALVGLLGVAIVGAAVAALLIITSNGTNSSRSASVASRTTNAPAPRRLVAFNPHTVTVAVLNGTATSGLAHRTGQRLTGAGYREGTVATATDQTRTATQVAYLPGYRSDALKVASTLKLSYAAVAPIDPGTRAVACPPPAACTANVVVTVGADLASVG